MANSESSDRIEASLIEALKDHEMSEEGDVLDHWLIIGHLSNPDSNTHGHGYPMLFSNGDIPPHIARGLLHTALLMFNKGVFE